MSVFDGFTLRAFLDLVAAATLAGGMFFMFVGALGVVRLPDAYNRIHAASICVTLGLTGLLIAACFHIRSLPIVAKATATIVFTFVAMPIGSHLLAKAAHHGKLPKWGRTLSDELEDDKLDPAMAATDDVIESGHSSTPSRAGASRSPVAADSFERRAQPPAASDGVYTVA
ncbi:MAG: monovalent cation/H(+) antiporter subunit G [Planctomycetota bacterium]|nr:MAG: monovalent cation/H(+) antiporter subunit G [Planctomycetota bacterium]